LPAVFIDLTFAADIKLNLRLSLRRRAKAIPSCDPTLPFVGSAHCNRRAIMLAALLFATDSSMIAESDEHTSMSMSPPTTWTETWHLWTVIVPRRSITGRLVHGKVWRRHDGHRWIYKKFIEHADDGNE
jgi:hypothetical protein